MNGDPGSEAARGPDCLKCAFFYVTWDSHFPRGCKVFEIKSRDLPSSVVLASTGRPCPSFRKSPRIRE